MYEKNQKQIAILLVLFVSTTTLTILSMNFQMISNDNIADVENRDDIGDIPQIGAPHAVIHIDNNWSAAEVAGICTGSGTMEDPWLIENYEITCGGSEYGVLVQNSRDPFRIKNCTVINAAAGGGLPDYGANIKIQNSTNGDITNNTCDNANQANILLLNSANISVTSNYISGSVNIGGLIMYNTNYTLISNNIFDANQFFAIQIFNISYSLFTGNVIDCAFGGIYVGVNYYCHNSTFDDNRISGGSAGDSMYFENSHNNVFKRNTISNSGANGIHLYDSDDNEIRSNKISGCDRGIYLESGGNLCDDNLIYKNYLTGNSVFNAYSSGNGNQWNSTWVGNYYDNHVGIDANNDGICDNTYTVNGTELPVDTQPIYGNPFHDGSPILMNGSLFGNTSVYWHYQRAYISGLGTEDEPLLLEDLVINGQNSSICIEINNPQNLPYMVIENCTVYNATQSIICGAIQLEDTENITIRNCDASNNPWYGIYINGNNNYTKVQNNYIKSCIAGIEIYQSNWTEVSGNFVEMCTNGIFIFDSNNFTISDNYVRYNYRGIYVYYESSSGNINSNMAIDNTNIGIYIRDGCWNISIWNNTAGNVLSGNQDDGISLEENCFLIYIFNNTVNDNADDGISLITNCDFNEIYNNTANGNDDNGIQLNNGCDNNTIYNNSIDDTITGIFLNLNCYYNQIYNNSILNTWNAFNLFFSHNNFLYTNTAYNNQFYGLVMQSSNGTFVAGNILNGDTGGKSVTDCFYTRDIINIYNGICTPILIDDNGGTVDALTWIEATNVPWIKGSGTEEDPYIIQDLEIDGLDSGSCIDIIDSTAYFVIQNCKLYNSENNIDSGGIRNYRTSNGRIFGNNCSNNKANGMRVYSNTLAENFTIYNNTCNNNGYSGIYTSRIDYFNISNNNLTGNVNSALKSYNLKYGIVHNNTCTGSIYGITMQQNEWVNFTYNLVNENSQYGLTINYHSNNNLIVNNIAINNDVIGIRLDDECEDNWISDNVMGNIGTTRQNYGVQLRDECSFNTVMNNIIQNHTFNGVQIQLSCNNNTIIGNTIGNSGTSLQNDGIYLNLNCHGNLLINNTISSLTNAGINIVDRCENTSIIGNNITQSPFGIYLHQNINLTTIVGNNISENDPYGIFFSECYNNTIQGNIINDNGARGIYFTTSSMYNEILFNEISNLHTTDQEFGVYLEGISNSTTLIGNMIYDNTNTGITISSSGYHYFTRNWVKGSPTALYEFDTYGNTYVLNNFNGEHDAILIDDNGGTAGAYTWAEIEQLTYWITGSGTGNDPYIIEDLIIDGHEADSCISVLDSEEVFIIQNCVLTNSSEDLSYDAGIYIDDTSNGTIRFNNVSWNTGDGIHLGETTQNIMVFNNTIHDNGEHGISIYRADNCNILSNLIYNNGWAGVNAYDGINVYDAEYNLIFNNTIHDSDDNGIESNGENNMFSNNTIYSCDSGLYLATNADNNTVYGNLIYNNDFVGLYLSISDYNNISWNTIRNIGSSAQDHGIRLYNDCNFNWILNNFIFDTNDRGIYIDQYCDNNTISGNNVSNYLTTNIKRGINLNDECHNNTISYNVINRIIWFGIQLYDNCNDNLIHHNIINETLINGYYGISIQVSSVNNTIYENIVIDTVSARITMNDANDNIFYRNTIYSPAEAMLEEDFQSSGNLMTNNFIYDSEGWHMDWLIINHLVVGERWDEASTYMWCSGTGAWNDPYLLENVEFDCLSESAGIQIIDSRSVYSRIQDCTFINTIDTANGAFIYLDDCQKVTLVNNDCSDSQNNGIYLIDSDYNTIYSNTINNNDGHGIYLKNSENNNISENLIYYNTGNGIYIETNKKNYIYGNDARYSGESGIKIVKGEDSDILNNQVNYNTWNGIHLDRSFFCHINGNIASNNDDNGIYLFNSYNNTIDTNTANNNGLYGISLLLSNNNTVNNNTVLSNQQGIYEESSTGNTITNNVDTIPPPPEDPVEPGGDTIINEGDTITQGDSAMGIAIAAIIIAAAIGAISILLLLKMTKENQELRNMVMTTNKSIKELKPSQPESKGPVKKAPANRTPAKK